MKQPILVATDFSARTDRAIDRAFLLADQLDGEVVLAHVLEHKPGKPVDTAQLDRAVKDVLPGDGADTRIIYPEGRIGEAIHDAAEQLGAAIIVMGVARYNSIGDYFLGTAVDHVLRHCAQPVLVVKKRPRGPYRRIGVATDFSQTSLEALKQAARLFPETPLHLIHAYRVPFEGLQKAEYVKDQVRDAEAKVFAEFMASVPEDIAARVTTHLVYGDPHRGIASTVVEEDLDLLVLGSHGESGFRHATLGSQANALLGYSAIDTIVISPVRA